MPPRQKVPENSSSISTEWDERLRHLMEKSGLAIFSVTFDPPIDLDLPEDKQVDLVFESGYVADANEAWAKMVGLSSAEDLIGVSIRDLAPPSIPENLQAIKMTVQSHFTLEDIETVELYESGEKRHFHNNIVWVVEEGRVTRMWGTAIDLTRRKDLEKKLGKLESDFRSSVEALGGTVRDGRKGGGRSLKETEASQNFIRRLKSLTLREHEVMTWVITGVRNGEIARVLGIVEGTVKIHRRRIMEKMGVVSVAELVRMCDRLGVEPGKVKDQ